MTKTEIKTELERLTEIAKTALEAMRANKTPENMAAMVEASKMQSEFIVKHELFRKPRNRYASRAGQRQSAENAAKAAANAKLKRKR